MWIEGDEVLLAELCGNLLDNALKYTCLSARHRAFERDGDAVTLVVEDSGPALM
ncbi:ATP-binding protein [Salmonella enterica subsp. enterica serovar Weltevreden]|nr:ATP-binding protein [Salmonella enterica subsp. enterica serovar Weltevreden]